MTETLPAEAIPTDLDPDVFSAVSKVVQLMMEQREQRALEAEASAATREARPERPALRRLYDVAGAADQLSLSQSKVWALIKAARLRTVKVDARTLIAASELDRFVADEVHLG